MALTVCKKCKGQVKGHKHKKQRKWYERTSVTLCVAAVLIIVAFGFIHVITGVVSPFDLPFDIVLKESFGYRETFVDAKKITAIPYTAARIEYPLGCKALQREGYIGSGKVFETRMIDKLRENVKKWQVEFDRAVNKPEQRWQDKLQGQTEAIERNPRDAEAYNSRGIASAGKGQYETAISDFTRAFQKNPVFAEAYYNRGLVYVAIGQLNQGVSDFTKALEIKPGFTEAYLNRGLVYVSMGQYDQAIPDLTRVLGIDPMRAEVYFRRSLVCYAKGEYDKAWEDVRKIQSLGLSVPSGFLKNLQETSGRKR